MSNLNPPSSDLDLTDAGILVDISLQIGRRFEGRPFIRIIKRTRKNTGILGTWKAPRQVFTVNEVQDVITYFTHEIMAELALTSGVQLALLPE